MRIECGLDSPYNAVILNRPLPSNFIDLARNATTFICADGGADRITRFNIIPTAICGDLDSISIEARDYFSTKQVPIIHKPSQDSTDFLKCLHLPHLHNKLPIYAFGGLGGRFDHCMQHLNILYTNPLENRQIILINESSIAFLVPAGSHQIVTDTKVFGPHLGFFPLASTAIVTTKGLVWDVESTVIGFGGLISTSNRIKEPFTDDGIHITEITTNVPLIWTISSSLYE